MAGYSTALRNARLDLITSTTGNAGLLNLYDGVRPATGGAATTLLGQFTCGTPFSGAAAAGVLSPTLPVATVGLAAGTVTWARLTTSAGVFVADLSIGTVGTEIIINTTTISIGLVLNVISWSINAGNP